MSEESEKSEQGVKRARQGRSPAYPSFGLQKAIDQAKKLYDAEGKYAVPLSSAFAAWGFGEKSSGGRQTKATLGYFDLIDTTENGNVKLSDKALRVLLDEREDQSEKKTLIRDLALTPPIHKELLEKFPDGIKSDPTAAHFLMFEKNFNKEAADELVAEFKATAEFSGLFKPDKKIDKTGQSAQNGALPPVVGDLVQWVVNGSHQFQEPKRVRAIQLHGEKSFVFVDGEKGGLPMDQIIVEKKGSGAGVVPPPIPELELEDEVKRPGVVKEMTSLDEGPAMLVWPENITEASYHDLEHWLNGILQKAKRRAGIKL
jgi:hypothetical protein